MHITALQAKVEFESLSLTEALEKAASENKFVFIDTYATWCAPCKEMDRIFDLDVVGDFYNKSFVNLKINMEGPQGPAMLQDYEVVFLPTLLILDHSGNIISKIDRLVNAEELIKIGKDVISGNNISQTHALNRTPFPSVHSDTKQDYDPSLKEEVIYIYDKKASSGRPHIMKHEAYLHLQLMDGLHQKVVKKYLSTQEDWSTENNIKFIFDFLQDVRSKEFNYFIENRGRFEELLGYEKVLTSLTILVHQRLEQGFPRPSIEEAEKLYNHIDPKNAKAKAYKYYLEEALQNKSTEDYLKVAEHYLHEINAFDHNIIYQVVRHNLGDSNTPEQLNEYLGAMILADALEEDNPEYLYTIAEIYYRLSQGEAASENIFRGIDKARAQGLNLTKYLSLKVKIEAL